MTRDQVSTGTNTRQPTAAAPRECLHHHGHDDVLRVDAAGRSWRNTVFTGLTPTTGDYRFRQSLRTATRELRRQVIIQFLGVGSLFSTALSRRSTMTFVTTTAAIRPIGRSGTKGKAGGFFMAHDHIGQLLRIPAAICAPTQWKVFEASRVWCRLLLS